MPKKEKIVLIGAGSLQFGLPQGLRVTATANDGVIMAVKHKEFPVEGVQFHPKSIRIKPHGMQILKNFLEF